MLKIAIKTVAFAILMLMPVLVGPQYYYDYNGNYPGNYNPNYYSPYYYQPYQYQQNYYYPYNNCQCSSGSCCDGCNFLPQSKICNVENDTQNGCPWGSSCGSDTGARTRTRYQYCSGSSSQCDGVITNWTDWNNWKVSNDCSSNQACLNGFCQAGSGCGIKYNSKKACYNNDVYWYDNYGNREKIFQECSDNNSCTIDSCEAGACANKPQCDNNSACKFGSEDYCKSCNHCGDNSCNCQENSDSCSKDCSPAVSASIDRSQKAGILSGLNGFSNFFKGIIKYWYVWLSILIPLVALIIIIRMIDGGLTAIGFALLNFIIFLGKNRYSWIAVALIAVLLFVIAPFFKNYIFLNGLVFLITRRYFWFFLGIIAIFLFLRFLDKINFFNKQKVQ